MSWDTIVSIAGQLPLLVLMLWYLERHDKRFLDTIEKLSTAIDGLREEIIKRGSAEEIAQQLSTEFWGKR
jgi:hypothetical protein